MVIGHSPGAALTIVFLLSFPFCFSLSIPNLTKKSKYDHGMSIGLLSPELLSISLLIIDDTILNYLICHGRTYIIKHWRVMNETITLPKTPTTIVGLARSEYFYCLLFSKLFLLFIKHEQFSMSLGSICKFTELDVQVRMVNIECILT